MGFDEQDVVEIEIKTLGWYDCDQLDSLQKHQVNALKRVYTSYQ